MLRKSLNLLNLRSKINCRLFSTQPHKKDLPSTHVQQQLNHMLSEQQIQEQTQKRKYQLQQKHSQLQKLIDKQIKLPLKLYGTKDTYSQKYSYLPDRIMAYYRIHPTMITDFLLKIYKASLYSMVDQNVDFMDEYWEQGLKTKVLQNIRQAKQKYTLSIVEDKDFLKNIPQSCQILDAICVRGLSMDRQANSEVQKYKKMVQADDVGLITYTPLYLTEDNERFIDPSTNKKIYEGYQNMVLRVLLRIRTPLRFNVKQIPISDQIYTWQHLVVMQNQMVAPKHLESKYKLQSLMQWLGKYRFGVWKVVDIDNFMKGNSFFRKYQDPDEVLDPIFEGTIFDRSSHANIRKF